MPDSAPIVTDPNSSVYTPAVSAEAHGTSPTNPTATTSKAVAIITDIHGCYKTLMALVAKLPADADIVLLGDLVDRGPDSKGVIEWAMKHAHAVALGNHEHMMLDFLDNVIPAGESQYDQGIWMMNGGSDCMRSFNGAVPEQVTAWLRSLPTHFIHPSYRRFLLSHTGHGLSPNAFDAVWNRDWSFPDDGYFRVFGHTQDKNPVITDTYAMIDTGCAYKHRGLGMLTALVLHSNRKSEFIQQPNIDQ